MGYCYGIKLCYLVFERIVRDGDLEDPSSPNILPQNAVMGVAQMSEYAAYSEVEARAAVSPSSVREALERILTSSPFSECPAP